MLEQLLQELNMVIYQGNGTDGPLTKASAEITTLTGYPQADFLAGQHCWMELIYPGDRNRRRQTMSVALNQKIPYAIEYRIITATGSIRWVLDQGRGDFDQSGGLTGIQGVLSDITEQKKQLNQLKARKEAYKNQASQFEAILDHMPGLVFYKDRNNCLIRVNKAVTEAYGFSKEELEGKHLNEIYPPEMADSYYQDDLVVINSGQPRLNIVESWETREGLRWLNTSKIPFRDEDGEIIGIIGMSFDITERINAENQVKVFQKAVEQSPSAIIITEPDGSISYVNKAFLAVTGYSWEEVRGRNTRILKYNKDAKIDYHELWATILSGKDWQGVFQNRKKNDQLYWERAIIAPLFDESGKLFKFIGIKQDITREHQNRLEMEKLYNVDMLTRVFNRRSFFEQAEQRFYRYQAETVDWAVLMLDIDFFKQINDTYGHAGGDQALRCFTDICKKNVRKTDLIGRVGGEEFAIYLDQTGFDDALLMAQRLRASVAANELVLDNGAVVRYTVSIGLAMPRPSDQKFEDVLKRADKALYAAKNNGRNRVETNL